MKWGGIALTGSASVAAEVLQKASRVLVPLDVSGCFAGGGMFFIHEHAS